MTDQQQAAKDAEDAGPPGKVDEVTGSEDVADRDGKEETNVDSESADAGFDPVSLGQQDAEGYLQADAVDTADRHPYEGPDI